MSIENVFLNNIWYYALLGEQLKRGKVLAKTILNEPILFGRTLDGEVFALRDICPH
ncbi:MAG: Rieske 2Fe-2S domain-containing protein, partial [Pseudanabaena sp. M114S2SP2A07QC]|nr:Rieske 2Fe-2S domain-containing protein [Pseudanabaena sp. M114S2SP2A07QC]